MVGLQVCNTYVDKAFIHALCFNGVSEKFVFTSAEACQGPNLGKLKSIAHWAIKI